MGTAVRTFWLLACLSAAIGGCAAGRAPAPPRASECAADQARLDAVVARLTSSVHGRHVRAAILDAPDPLAYAWPDGRMLLTCGLVRLLDDHELAAAVAHEMGHLLEDGHIRAPVALAGTSHPPDVESRADAAGAALLIRAGYPAAAMPRMLEKVAASHRTPKACKARLLQRVRRLRA